MAGGTTYHGCGADTPGYESPRGLIAYVSVSLWKPDNDRLQIFRIDFLRLSADFQSTVVTVVTSL
jgi:hypothetical protein